MALAALVGVIAAGFFAINAVIDVKALQKSTHSIVTDSRPMDVFEDFNADEVLADISKAEDQFNGLRGVDNEYDIV